MQNLFYRACAWSKLSVKRLRIVKCYGILAILIFGLVFTSISMVLSIFTTNVLIRSSGRISTVKELITYTSEIRGVFIFEDIFVYSHDWDIIAETLKQYGINAVFVNDFSTFGIRTNSEIRAAIDAFHARGIQYHSVMAVLQDTKPTESLGTEAIRSDGTVYNAYSHCPIKAHDYVISSIQDYLTEFPDVDGIMLDFIRYDHVDMCYCEHCRAAFEEWLGENITDWTQFYPDQPRWEEYAEWRTEPVTELVKDIHDLIKSVNPNIVLSEAAWTLFSDCPIYWRKYLGQDTACWIKEGYIDFVAPMMYTKSLSELEDYINTDIKYWTGGQPEGKIPLVAFLRNDFTDVDATPEEFEAEINLVRQKGLDGWIIWRYGGPGSDAPHPDIRDYLSVIDMPQVFTISHINVEVTSNTATISWFTDVHSTSSVEYSTAPLFNASWQVWGGFHYWNITYNRGTIVEHNDNVTIHSITIDGLASNTTYYFRVHCKGESGIATSKALKFTTTS